MSWYWAVVRGDCGIVSANATVRVRSLMRRGIDRDPNQMGLASSIGINRKGTRPPLKTASADALILNLRRYSGGAVVM